MFSILAFLSVKRDFLSHHLFSVSFFLSRPVYSSRRALDDSVMFTDIKLRICGRGVVFFLFWPV